jgi:hypothetical protein
VYVDVNQPVEPKVWSYVIFGMVLDLNKFQTCVKIPFQFEKSDIKKLSSNHKNN